MRILVLSSLFPSDTRPTQGVFVLERVRHLAPGCAIVVVAPILWFPLNRLFRGRERAGAAFVEKRAGLTVYHPRVLCVPGIAKCLDGLLYFLTVLPFVAWLWRRFRFDLVDAHFSYPDGLAGVLLGRLFGCPTVVTLRGSHDLRQASRRLRRPQVRFTLRAAARIITVSASLRDFALRLGAPGHRVRVISNGVDALQFAIGDRASARRAVGLPLDRPILLSVGNLVEGKGHHQILKILPALVARRPDLLYVVVGGTPGGTGYHRRLQSLVQHHQLQRHVRLVGPRPHSEISRWMVAADLFCLATRTEGWCNAIMEALACGVPVVTTRVGGNAELVREGIDGFLVPYGDVAALRDAVLTALDRPWDRDAISANARANGWERTAEQVLAEFRCLLAGDDATRDAPVAATPGTR